MAFWGCWGYPPERQINPPTCNLELKPTEQAESPLINKNAECNRKQTNKKSNDGNYHKESLYNDLLDENEKLKKERDYLQTHCKELERQCEQFWDKSAAIFRKQRPQHLESICDDYPLIEITKKFTHLYSNEWLDLCMTGGHEHQTIVNISTVMMEIYGICRMRAKKQLQEFLNLDEGEEPPARHEDPTPYRLRRLVNIKPDKTNKFAEKVVRFIITDKSRCREEVSSFGQSENEFLDFFEAFAGICWQLAIAEEEIILDFDAVNQPYEGDIEKRFHKRELKYPIYGLENIVNTLVWPCIRKVDEKKTVMEMGFVIVNTKKPAGLVTGV